MMKKILSIGFIYNLFIKLIGGNKASKWLAINHWRISEGDKVLDMGCGTSECLKYLPKIDYTGFDPSTNYLKKQPFGATLLKGTVHELKSNFTKPEYDVVMCNGLLHHLKYREACEAVELAYKALKKGGRLLCIEPVYLKTQARLSKWMVSQDRGIYVRHESEYKRIIKDWFDNFDTNVLTGLLNIPYTHLLIEAVKERETPKT